MSDNNKIINFAEAKAKLLDKMYPNINSSLASGNKNPYKNMNKALEDFQDIFVKYVDSIKTKNSRKEIKLDEVLYYFNLYFDTLYAELSQFDDSKVRIFKQAMDYAMLGSGKRLRPFLMFATYYFCRGEDFTLLSGLMVSIEMIHTFSLIHDDLPCMDNDPIRRGKPSVWKKYGEDMGVLVGDALMMHASAILCETILELGATDIGAYLVTSSLILMRLAGLDGMITGQVFDVLNTQNKNLTVDDIDYMYAKKTTALLTAAMVIGANMAGTLGEDVTKVEELGYYLGMAYQIKDDLLEIESTTEKIGKSVDSDKNNGKITYVTLNGVDNSKKKLLELYALCMKKIDELTVIDNVDEALVYKQIITYVLEREK